jgi:inner membrane protein
LDTGTHIAMGIGLGCLAYLQPSVAAQPELASAILLCTLVGSNAPDFDTVLKLKGNASYIRNHRGLSHSWPALIGWSLLISIFFFLLLPVQTFWPLLLWSSIAVFLHAIVDIFNSYGTQLLRPQSKRWVALNVIYIFDWFIFSTLMLGIVFWLSGLHPGYVFLVAFSVIALYYIWRILVHRKVERQLVQLFPNCLKVMAIPAFSLEAWHAIIKTDTYYYIGKLKKGQFELHERLAYQNTWTHQVHKASKDVNINAFLSFSSTYVWEEKKTADGYEIRFVDLRYQQPNMYPFMAIAKLDHKGQVVSSYTGWIFNEEKLDKRLALKQTQRYI